VHPPNEVISESPVGERHILEGCADEPTARSERNDTTDSADACGAPVANITLGRRTRSRIGVTAVWHRQQSISPMLWDSPRPKGLVVR